MIITWLLENITVVGPVAFIAAIVTYFKLKPKRIPQPDIKPQDMVGIAIGTSEDIVDDTVSIASGMADKGDDHNTTSVELLGGLTDTDTITAESVDSNTSIEDINNDFENKGF